MHYGIYGKLNPTVIGWTRSKRGGIVRHSTHTATQNADGRLEVFAVGPDIIICHTWQTQPNNE